MRIQVFRQILMSYPKERPQMFKPQRNSFEVEKLLMLKEPEYILHPVFCQWLILRKSLALSRSSTYFLKPLKSQFIEWIINIEDHLLLHTKVTQTACNISEESLNYEEWHLSHGVRLYLSCNLMFFTSDSPLDTVLIPDYFTTWVIEISFIWL